MKATRFSRRMDAVPNREEMKRASMRVFVALSVVLACELGAAALEPAQVVAPAAREIGGSGSRWGLDPNRGAIARPERNAPQ